jgi:hypothetical protein
MTTKTTTKSLTDRYVDAVMRSVPARQREDIERELRASIADAVDDRLAAGGDPARAETEVLTELGNPAKLAAGYADRPLQLIGPGLYLGYLRLLTALLVTVVPAVAAINGVLHGLEGDSAGQIIGGTLGAVITAGVHVVFWTTLAFAAIERMPDLKQELSQPWTPDSLPVPPSRRARYGELISLTVLFVLCTTFLLISPMLRIHTDAQDQPIGLFSPWLWETGVIYLCVALPLGGLVFAFARHYLRWSVPLAITGLVVDIGASLLLIWLVVNDRLLNPAFAEAAQWPDEAMRWVSPVLIVIAVGSMLSSINESVTHFRRN